MHFLLTEEGGLHRRISSAHFHVLRVPQRKRPCSTLHTQPVIKRRLAEKSFAAGASTAQQHMQRVTQKQQQKKHDSSGPVERTELASGSLLDVEPNRQTQDHAEPVISICSFFRRKSNLRVPSYPARLPPVISPLLPPIVTFWIAVLPGGNSIESP